MPAIAVTASRHLDPAARQALAARLTDLVADVMGKRREVTSVHLADGVGAFFVGGRAVESGAQVEITVTAGTNDAGEKAAMVAATMEALAGAFGPLPEATYVIVREVAAESWGYGGLTQAGRKPLTLPSPS